MYQIAIVTTWHTEYYDTCQNTHFTSVESLDPIFLEAEAISVSYDVARYAFEDYLSAVASDEDFMFAEDKDRGYTEEQTRIYIDHQTIICNNPETNQLQVIYCRDGDCHECWTKPEEDA